MLHSWRHGSAALFEMLTTKCKSNPQIALQKSCTILGGALHAELSSLWHSALALDLAWKDGQLSSMQGSV